MAIDNRVTISITMTYNLGNYESAKIGVSLEAQLEVEKGDTLETVAQDMTGRILEEIETARAKV